MSEAIYIPFEQWLPDQQSTNNRGLEIARNVIPVVDGFRGYPSAVRVSSNTLDQTAVGFFATTDGDGTAVNFAGDEQKLYLFSAGSTWTDVSRTPAYSNTVLWDFTIFEANVIATNFTNEIQSYVIGTSAAFADLSASAPKARYVTVVRDHVLAGYTNDTTDGTVPYRVWRSARADPTDWTPSAATQAGFFDIFDAGPITGLVGGAFGIAFTSGGVHRLTYVGSPIVFQRDEIGNGIGCEVPGSIVKRIESRGELAFIYFKSRDGFAVTDGSTVREIGNERVNQWFFDNFDSARANQMTGGIYGLRDTVVWSFPSTVAENLNDSYIAFSYSSNKWSYGNIETTQIGQTLTPATFLEDVTDPVDDVTTPVDSNVWNGGASVFGGIDHEGFLITFTGTNLQPEFVTGDYRFGPGRMRVGRIWPDVDGTVTTNVAYAENTKQFGAYSPDSNLRRGYTTHRGVTQNGNLFQIRVRSDASFTEAKGLNVEVYKGGS